MTPESSPRLPVWPESQQGRFRCVHIGVNDHQQGCQQPLQCFYNGILILSPHHPAELKSAPVCLLLVRLLLKTGNGRQPLQSAYLWGGGIGTLRAKPLPRVPQQLCKCCQPPRSQGGEPPPGTGKGAGRGALESTRTRFPAPVPVIPTSRGTTTVPPLSGQKPEYSLSGPVSITPTPSLQ